MATKTAINKIKIESTQTQGEMLCLEMLENLGIGHKLVSEKHRLYQLEMSGSPLLRCYESLADQRADEKKLEQIADQTKTPVVGMIRPDAFGATTYVPGVGPVPIAVVKAGALFDGWGMSGHATLNSLALTLRSEAQHLGKDEPMPYTEYLMAALGIEEKPQTSEELMALINRAAESPHKIGLPAALQAASGRGSHQAVLMFDPHKTLDTNSSIPDYEKNSWLWFDLGRAIGSETPSSRRAHGLVHQSLVSVLGMNEALFVSYRVDAGVKKELQQGRKSLNKAIAN